jgi:hypothetical protein
MRHPWDFWKALICANIFIYVMYMAFGITMYSLQAQFSFNPVMQGLSPYNYQTAANVMFIITGLIAACLYGNVGIKVNHCRHWLVITNSRNRSSTQISSKSFAMHLVCKTVEARFYGS